MIKRIWSVKCIKVYNRLVSKLSFTVRIIVFFHRRHHIGQENGPFFFHSAERQHFEVTPPTWPPDVPSNTPLVVNRIGATSRKWDWQY